MADPVPCSSDPSLFDSVDYWDRQDARQVCLTCPSRRSCRAVALTDPQASGTYGGDLFNRGSVILAINA